MHWADTSVWYSACLSGEAAPVELADDANVQDNGVVEGTPGHPASIGRGCTLGHNARVFGAVVEERSMIAIGATVLPGARVGAQSIISANATVPEGMEVPPKPGHRRGRVVPVTDAEMSGSTWHSRPATWSRAPRDRGRWLGRALPRRQPAVACW